MADATSSGSGSSGLSEGRRRIHPRTCGGSKPSSSNADPSLVHEHLKPPSEHSLGTISFFEKTRLSIVVGSMRFLSDFRPQNGS